MATVAGNVRTWGLGAFPTNERLRVLFVPSNAGVGSTSLYPQRTEYVYPDSAGAFTVNLAVTTSMSPVTWYEIRFEWLRMDPDGDWQIEGWSDLPGRLHVPPGGGDVGDLLGDYVGGTPQLFIGHGPPPSWLPSPGVYYDLSGPDGPIVYSDGVLI